ncbi:MAG: tetratricopeptide repeat protein [Bacteroidia bacterium]|nr:sel1 repeat family protein [Bacteroidia bacterium]MDW8134612.1 tetratricopeptide repeat protein [Bacteroidia bacterium]
MIKRIAFWGIAWAQLSITTGVIGRDERFQLKRPSAAEIDSLRRLAFQGDVQAQMAMVEYYQLIELRSDSARFYLTQAARKGLPEAQYLLGLSYLRGVEGPRRPIEGRKLLEAAAKQNYILAIRVLYEVLEPPDSISPLTVAVLPYNPRQAFEYASQGAKLGDPLSMTALGRYYAQGKGTARNDSLAHFWLLQAAEKGYIPAQVLLAEWCFEKWNNPKEALYWANQVIQNERASLEEQYRARIAAYTAEYFPRWLRWFRRWLLLPEHIPQWVDKIRGLEKN